MDERDGAKTLEDGASVEIEESMETEEIAEAKEPAEVEKPADKKPAEKKKTNVTAIVFGLLALVFAGVAAFFGVEYFINKPSEQPSGPVATPDNNTEPSESQPIVDTEAKKTSENMAKEYKEVYDLVRELVADLGKYKSNYIETGSSVVYKPEGMNTYVPMRFDLRSEVFSDDNEADAAKIVSRLKEKGFESIGIMPFLGSAGPRIEGYYNSTDNIVCEVYGDISYVSQDVRNESAIVACAKTTWHWLTDEEKELAKGLEKAYYNKTGMYPSILTGFENKIKNSKYEPYQHMYVSVGGAAGLFYRTSPEAEWQYFTATQGVIECDDYNTEDLKKAFLGEGCYDYSARQDSTVQL